MTVDRPGPWRDRSGLAYCSKLVRRLPRSVTSQRSHTQTNFLDLRLPLGGGDGVAKQAREVPGLLKDSVWTVPTVPDYPRKRSATPDLSQLLLATKTILRVRISPTSGALPLDIFCCFWPALAIFD